MIIMETLTFKTTIQSPIENVYEALCNKRLFGEWTSVFNPVTYTYNGWESATEEYFLGFGYPAKEGTAPRESQEQDPEKRIVTIHMTWTEYETADLFDEEEEEYPGSGDSDFTDHSKPCGGKLSGYDVAQHNYDDQIELTIKFDCPRHNMKYFNQTWPIALEKVKTIAERL